MEKISGFVLWHQWCLKMWVALLNYFHFLLLNLERNSHINPTNRCAGFRITDHLDCEDGSSYRIHAEQFWKFQPISRIQSAYTTCITLLNKPTFRRTCVCLFVKTALSIVLHDLFKLTVLTRGLKMYSVKVWLLKDQSSPSELLLSGQRIKGQNVTYGFTACLVSSWVPSDFLMQLSMITVLSRLQPNSVM